MLITRVSKLIEKNYGRFEISYDFSKRKWCVSSSPEILRLLKGSTELTDGKKYFHEKQFVKIKASLNERLDSIEKVKSFIPPEIKGLNIEKTDVGTWKITGSRIMGYRVILPNFVSNSRAGLKEHSIEDCVYLLHEQLLNFIPLLKKASRQLDKMQSDSFLEYHGLTFSMSDGCRGVLSGPGIFLFYLRRNIATLRNVIWTTDENGYGIGHCSRKKMNAFAGEVNSVIWSLKHRAKDAEARISNRSQFVEAVMRDMEKYDLIDKLHFEVWGPYLKFTGVYRGHVNDRMRTRGYTRCRYSKAWYLALDEKGVTEESIRDEITYMHEVMWRHVNCINH